VSNLLNTPAMSAASASVRPYLSGLKPYTSSARWRVSSADRLARLLAPFREPSEPSSCQQTKTAGEDSNMLAKLVLTFTLATEAGQPPSAGFSRTRKLQLVTSCQTTRQAARWRSAMCKSRQHKRQVGAGKHMRTNNAMLGTT
jgi:hypothetical protein